MHLFRKEYSQSCWSVLCICVCEWVSICILVCYHLTTVYKHQLPSENVSLGEVQDVPEGGILQSQVSIAGRGHDELQSLRLRVPVLSTQVVHTHLCYGAHPHLDTVG